MAVPIELEILMKDYTKQGFSTLTSNLKSAEMEADVLLAALNKIRDAQIKAMNENKKAGASYGENAANVQALTGEINKLEAALSELRKEKAANNETPIVNAQQTVDMDRVARKTANLQMQFSQVARELPSLTMGPQMFIMAISNNLPMLADAISDVRKENELLKASGKASVPVWKQMAGALFSWQTGLIALISLGIVYGQNIADWTKKLFKHNQEMDEAAKRMKNLNQVMDEGAKGSAKERVQLDLLYDITQDHTRSIKERTKAANDLKKQYPDYFGKLTNEAILTGNASDAYKRLTENILKAAQARSAMKIIEENYDKIYQKQKAIKEDEEWTKAHGASSNFGKATERVTINMPSSAGGFSQTVEGLTQEAGEYNRRNQQLQKNLEEVKKIQEENQALAKDIDAFSLSGTGGNGGSGGNGDNRKDYSVELAKARLRAEETVERLRIQVHLEGREKRKASAQQEYQEQKREIDRQEQETIAQMNEARQNGETITDSQYETVRYNAEQQRALRQQVLNQKLQAIDREYMDKAIDDQIAYNKKYGTYAEQRAAIMAEAIRKSATAESDAGRAMIQKQMEEALQELDFKQFKDTIDFAAIFGDLDSQNTEALSVLRDKLKEYIAGAAKDLRPEDLKELQDAFKELDLKIAERSPYSEFKQGLKEFKASQEEVSKAQQDLNTVMEGGEIITGHYMDENGKLVKKLLSVEQAEKNLTDAQHKRQETLSRLTKSANAIGSQGMEVVNAGRDIVDMLGSFGVKVPEALGNTLDGIGQVMSGLESIDLTKPFSAISGVTGVLTGIGKTIGGIFGFGGADYSGYENLKAKYETLIDVWDTLIGKKMEYIDIDYGIEASKAADEARKMIETQIARQRELALKLGKSGSSIGSHSLAYRVNDRMGKNDWNRLSSLVGQKVGSIQDIFNLDASIIGKVLEDEKFVSVLAKVNNEFIDYIQNMDKYSEQLEQLTQQEKEAITGIGLDAFKEGWIDMLSDLDSTNEDFAKNFEKHLQNAILRSLIANKYADDIERLYDTWVKYGKDGLSKEEVESLRKLQQELANRLQEEREQLKDTFGWETESGNGSSQSPQSGALTTMSQDSINTFEGIGRSLQTHVISMDKELQEIKQSGKEDSEALMQIIANTAHLLPIREILEKFDHDGIKVQ